MISTVGFLAYLFTVLVAVESIRWARRQKSFWAVLALNVAVAELALTGIFGLMAGIVWGWFATVAIVTVGFAAVVLTMIGAGQLVRAESNTERKRP